MANVLELNSGNFESEVLKAATPVLVDFTATWCGPCKQLAPIVEELAKDYAAKVKIGKVDIDENQDLAAQYGVMAVPTLLLFKNGKVRDQSTGVMPKTKLAQKLDQSLAG
jgi:thioredoxin 1